MRHFQYIFLVSAILIYKIPHAFITPQFWAEDGSVFFQQAHLGFHAFMIPYAGYLHVIPRLCSYLAYKFNIDLLYLPIFYALFSLICTLGIFFLILNNRLCLSTPAKLAMALSIILIPHSGEVLLNITNLHWILAIYITLSFIQPKTSTLRNEAIETCILIPMYLSSPLAALACFGETSKLIKLLNDKNVRFNFITKLCILRLLVATIQSLILISSGLSFSAENELPYSSNINLHHLYESLPYAFSFLFQYSFLGDGVSNQLILRLTSYQMVFVRLLIYISFITLVSITFFSLRNSRHHLSLFIYFFFLSFGLALICYSRVHSAFEIVDFFKFAYSVRTRYSYITLVLISWSLIVACDSNTSHRHRLAIYVSLSPLLLLLLTSFSSFVSQPLINCNWQHYVNEYKNSRVLEIPIPPDCGVVWKVKPDATAYK